MFHLSIFALFIFFTSLSRASDIENPLQYRQDNNTSPTTLSPAASPSPSFAFSPTLISQSADAPTADSTTSSPSDTATASLQGAAKPSSTTSTTQPGSSLSAESKSTTLKDESSHATSSTTTPTGSVTRKIVTTIVSISGSVTLSFTSTSSQVIAAALASATSSGSAQLDGSGGSGAGGLTSTSKSIIGGVVGGVGGAILLGGLAIVFWRVWGRNRRPHGAENNLMGAQPGQEKSSSVSGQGPFRSTLDQYHNPGPVNTASNF